MENKRRLYHSSTCFGQVVLSSGRTGGCWFSLAETCGRNTELTLLPHSYCMLCWYLSSNYVFYITQTVRNQIKENEMGGECSTHGGKEGCIQDFGGET
jgi:hypothetical protein